MNERYEHIVEALRHPGAYAREGPAIHAPIEVIETHVSHLFLTGAYVYKLKKPVDLGFIDLTTLEKRRANCERELALNRRLSPDVYLGMLPVVAADYRFVVGEPGEPVDWVVKMRQLPRDRMLDALLKREAVSEDDVRAIARRIADFHAAANRSAEVTRIGGRAGVLRRIDENFSQTAHYVGHDIPRAAYEDIVEYNHAFFTVRDDSMRRREEKGCVVDGHGDLHAAQICIDGDTIEFIDCIEFSQDYRYGDVALDLAFLAMDLDHYERRDLSEALVDEYVRASGDERLPELLTFYKSYRAYVRGKVASITVDNARLTKRTRAAMHVQASSYYSLAHRYALAALPPRNLFAVMGLSGTGKSMLAKALAGHWNLPVTSSDVERKRVAGEAFGRQQFWGVGEGLYSREMDARTYDALFGAAARALSHGSAVLDATFRDEAMRRRAIDLANASGAQAWFIECTASDDEVHRRIDARAAQGTDPSDATWEVYLNQRKGWEGVGEVAPAWHVRVDTDTLADGVLRRALRGVFERAIRG